MNIPLSTLQVFYQQLLDNHRTQGTDEQKMLVLRRRFDAILRAATGPFTDKSGSFYTKSMLCLQNSLGTKKQSWAEYWRMKDAFNMLMHDDIEVDRSRYLLSLSRLSSFINTLSDVAIPSELINIISRSKGIAQLKISTKIPVICCIDKTAIPDMEERNVFNNAANVFRTELLNNSSICDKIDFKFFVSESNSVYLRDLSNGPQVKFIDTGYPREESVKLAVNELNGKKDGILMTIFGGKELCIEKELSNRLNALGSSIKFYPIIVSSLDSPYSGLSLCQRPIQMLPDCYDEFFSWLYDSIVLYYSK